MVKESIIFSIGAAAGFTVAIIFCKKKYQKQAEDEIASMKDYMYKKIESYKNEAMKANKVNEMSHSISKEEKKKMKRNKEAYRDYASPYISEEEDKDVPEEELDENFKAGKIMSKEMETNKDGPIEIEPENFGELPINDIETVFYYTGNDILSMEDETIVEDEKALFGDLLDTTGFKEDDSIETIYIRNMALTTDYEITKVQSYYEA